MPRTLQAWGWHSWSPVQIVLIKLANWFLNNKLLTMPEAVMGWRSRKLGKRGGSVPSFLTRPWRGDVWRSRWRPVWWLSLAWPVLSSPPPLRGSNKDGENVSDWLPLWCVPLLAPRTENVPRYIPKYPSDRIVLIRQSDLKHNKGQPWPNVCAERAYRWERGRTSQYLLRIMLKYSLMAVKILSIIDVVTRFLWHVNDWIWFY